MTLTRPRRALPRRSGAGSLFSAGAIAGALAAYFFDPEGGRRRRHLARDRAAGTVRRGVRRTARLTRTAVARTLGRGRGLAYRFQPPLPAPLDDVELAHKVESILFRDPALPKGRLNINAEKGTVFLRGQVDSPELVRELEKRVAEITGVRDVENLLHLPGTPAPASHGRPKAPGAESRG